MPQLDRLGLKENPFNNNTSQRFFYADHSRAQIMESTEHLIEFSNNLQVVIGAHGVGKSHFLEALEARTGNNWRVVKIKDTAQYDMLSLIQAIMNSFGAISDGSTELLESLETQLSEINQLGAKPVLLIDNAQNLSSDSMRFLMQLSQQEQNDEPYIHIVLFATSIITEILQSSDFKEFRDSVHVAILDTFDKEGVAGYLKHKLAVAGFDRESPFSPRIIDSIFNDSAGIPEKINFFAEKFLTSSGKAEDYIQTKPSEAVQNFTDQHFSDNQASNSSYSDSKISNTAVDDSEPNKQSIEFESQDKNICRDETTNIFDDINALENNSNQIDDQLSRLTEQFEEIEKMGDNNQMEEQTTFFNREHIDEDRDAYDHIENNGLADDNFLNETSPGNNPFSRFSLAKVIIPLATIITILVVVFAINSMFNQTKNDSVSPPKQVELLPLELPPEVSFEIEESNVEVDAPPPQLNSEKSETQIKSMENQDTAENPELKVVEVVEIIENPQLESVGVIESVETVEIIETDKNNMADTEIVTQDEEKKVDIIPELISDTRPEINTIEPSPLIGSAKQQSIYIKGQNFSSEMSLFLFYDNKKKEFSKLATPQQWFFESANSIKLNLTTGVNSQQWSIIAQTKDSAQSNTVIFDIIKPFTKITTINKEIKISKLSPNPMIASDNRQSLTISGQGFSKDTIIELTWGKNKKQFSRNQTPSQFEYHSPDKIQLFITTGKVDRQWHVTILNQQKKSYSSSFKVILDNADPNEYALYSKSTLHNEKWLLQQKNEYYTLQLFGSENKSAITDLINKYSLKGNIARFETQRDGKTWFSMTYGRYLSRQEASAAITTLNPKLITSKPWIRSFASIKKQIQQSQTNHADSEAPINQQKIRNDAWIWTQNPADYTLQLITLSTEQAVKDFARSHKIEQQSTQFSIKSQGKIRFVLVYGVYTNKESADKAKENLALKIAGLKPWVRKFSAIHELMSRQ